MNICVNFESWTIADGSYSPMKKGDIVVFAIGIDIKKIKKLKRKKKSLVQKKYSDYHFCGEVIYKSQYHKDIMVVNTGIFKFFMSVRDIALYEIGQTVSGEGSLSIDSYEWMHIWSEKGAPHIYYDFGIQKILGYRDLNNKEIDTDDESFIDGDAGIEIIILNRSSEDELYEMETIDDEDLSVKCFDLKMIKEAEPFKIISSAEYTSRQEK